MKKLFILIYSLVIAILCSSIGCAAHSVQINAKLLQRDTVISEVTFTVQDKAEGDATLGNLISNRQIGTYMVFAPTIQSDGRILLKTSGEYCFLKGTDSDGAYVESVKVHGTDLLRSGEQKTYAFKNEDGTSRNLRVVITPSVL